MKTLWLYIGLSIVCLPLAGTAAPLLGNLDVPVASLQYVTGYAGNYAPFPDEGTVELPGGTFMQYQSLTIQVLDDGGTPLLYDAATQTIALRASGTRLSLQCANPQTGVTYSLDRFAITQTAHSGWQDVYYVPLVEANGRSPMVLDGDTYTWQSPGDISVIEVSITSEGTGNVIQSLHLDYSEVVLPAPVITGPTSGFSGTGTVTITSSVPSAAIYYTTSLTEDGQTTPTPSSTLYTGPITIEHSTWVSAIAVMSGYASTPADAFFYANGGLTALPAVLSAVPAGEIARYSLDGRKVDTLYHGVVIARYTNGAAHKLIAR